MSLMMGTTSLMMTCTLSVLSRAEEAVQDDGRRRAYRQVIVSVRPPDGLQHRIAALDHAVFDSPSGAEKEERRSLCVQLQLVAQRPIAHPLPADAPGRGRDGPRRAR